MTTFAYPFSHTLYSLHINAYLPYQSAKVYILFKRWYFLPYFLDFIGEKPSLPYVNAELFGNETDDMGWEDLHVRLHTHRLQFFLKGFTPAHQRLCGDARTVGKLLFRHCFH